MIRNKADMPAPPSAVKKVILLVSDTKNPMTPEANHTFARSMK